MIMLKTTSEMITPKMRNDTVVDQPLAYDGQTEKEGTSSGERRGSRELL